MMNCLVGTAILKNVGLDLQFVCVFECVQACVCVYGFMYVCMYECVCSVSSNSIHNAILFSIY